MRKQKIISTRGFTLIEILLSSVIMVILAGGILSIQYIIGRSRTSLWKNYLSVEEANRNITSLVQEIRNARFGDNGTYSLVKADDQEMIFYSDVDNDDQAEKLRYTLKGTLLEKGVIEPVGIPPSYPQANEQIRTVASYIKNNSTPIFYFYNGDWPTDTINNPLDTPARLSETKLMKVHLVINPDLNESDNDFVVESYSQIRMLKNNL